MREITDIQILEWLEKNCNGDMLNFQQSKNSNNLIDAYFFAVFYKDKIREIMMPIYEENNTFKNV